MIALSLPQARRVALAAQGFGRARPATVGAAHVLRLVERLGLFQIDSVNVLARAHYLPAYSRLGGYDPALVDAMAWGPRPKRRLFEYWAHEASLLPLSLHSLLRWRMARAERGAGGWGSLRPFAGERRAEAEAVLARIRAEGPLTTADFAEGKGSGGWWAWSDAKRALEWLFAAGLVTTATRRGSFARVYDLAERVIPPAVLALPTPDEATAHRALIEHAARSHGIATARDLRDYFRLDPAGARVAILSLVEEGVLRPATVEGWSRPAWLHRDALLPRRVAAVALLSPFDPLVWERDRTERLFAFRYRIGIYTPAAARTEGYYALPFLLGDRLAARVDLKADRARSTLLVRQTILEADAPAVTRDALGAELRRLANWLGLEVIA